VHARKLTLTTFNLYNLNEPGLRMYRKDGWTEDEYKKKISWTGWMLGLLRSDVFGFQELWHAASLQRAFQEAKADEEYALLVPEGHAGQSIVCAAAVRRDMLVGEPEWITRFPDAFKLESSGDDAQTPDISVNLDAFSRPVLHFSIRPRDDEEDIQVYVCHFKSKRPTDIFFEGWYRDDKTKYEDHRKGIGAGLSTIRRTAEATALRIILTERLKRTHTPIIVLGDLNDGELSNTLNILTEQPRYLTTLSTGGGDTSLYSGQTLQQYRSERDVYYTHVYRGMHESLDHILVSEEFYDNSRDRIWAFDGMDVYNDHLNRDEHKDRDGTNDHGIVRTHFVYKPARKVDS
jgi:hypothetical protein